jgi:hypothetical protein
MTRTGMLYLITIMFVIYISLPETFEAVIRSLDKYHYLKQKFLNMTYDNTRWCIELDLIARRPLHIHLPRRVTEFQWFTVFMPSEFQSTHNKEVIIYWKFFCMLLLQMLRSFQILSSILCNTLHLAWKTCIVLDYPFSVCYKCLAATADYWIVWFNSQMSISKIMQLHELVQH